MSGYSCPAHLHPPSSHWPAWALARGCWTHTHTHAPTHNDGRVSACQSPVSPRAEGFLTGTSVVNQGSGRAPAIPRAVGKEAQSDTD